MTISSDEFVLALMNLKGWGATKVSNYVFKHEYDLEECLNFLEIEIGSEAMPDFESNLRIAKEELKCNRTKHIESISLFDERFPKKLCETKEPVVHLYFIGDVSLLNSKCITVIGTRKPDYFFAKKGYKVASYFAKRGYTIVSGLALGCDSIGHRAALDTGGKTIAILPSSLDKIVPIQNRELAKEIVRNGGLVISEYSVTSTMNRFNYPQRDRIQSFLSNVSIIIQSNDNGGTMIAVKKSMKDGKEVYAINGNHLSLVNNYFDVDSNEDLASIEVKL